MPTEPYYDLQVPLIGQPDNYFTICRCITVESVAEVVRVLLLTKDPALAELRVVRQPRIG